MRHALVDLLRNLAAGARLALFRPVGITSFRITLGSVLALIAFAYGLEIALDALRIGAGATFNANALPRAAFGTGVMLLLVAVLAVGFRQPHLMLALTATFLASAPLVNFAGNAYYALGDGIGRWTPSHVWIAWACWLALTAWGVAIGARAVAITLSPRPRYFRTAVLTSAALVFGAGYLVETRFPPPDWWLAARAPERADAWSVVTERALVRQPQLLAESLQAIEPQRPGVVDLYFIGFAPYAGQDVFRRDVDTAHAVVNDRYGVEGRSIVLVNHPRTVMETPLATASNLRTTLKAVGARIDPEEDVVMLFLTSHGGADHRLAVEFNPLQLDQISGADLRTMLDEAGIRFRIVVISACYSGGFIPALSDERTLVLTAAAADRTSFGCSTDSPMTFFTDALFNQALRSEASLSQAFAQARTLVAERERAEGLSPPSDPQMFAGAAIGAKLDALASRGVPPRTPVCAAGGC